MDGKRKIRESLEISYEDERRETISIRRLKNSDLIRWVDARFDKAFLVFRSVERADVREFANQDWFDSLTQASALNVVEKALELNHSPDLQKKILQPALAVLQSFYSALPSSSSSTVEPPSAS